MLISPKSSRPLEIVLAIFIRFNLLYVSITHKSTWMLFTVDHTFWHYVSVIAAVVMEVSPVSKRCKIEETSGR